MADARLPALTALSTFAPDDYLYLVDKSDTTDHASGSSKYSELSWLAGYLFGASPQGRITTESGVPVSASDRTSQGALYWKPCTPNGTPIDSGWVGFYDGTRVVGVLLSELSLDLSTAEAGGAIDSGENYDVFIDYNGGSPALVLGGSWTNDTTRATALATQGQLTVLTGNTDWTWVGTIRASGSGVVEDSNTKRFVWNAHNRVPRVLYREESGTWTYTSATVRQANANTANQVAIIAGAVGCVAHVGLNAQVGSNINVASSSGIGINTTSAYSNTAGIIGWQNHTSDGREMYYHILTDHARVGYTFYSWNESSNGVGEETFRGGNLCGAFNA